MEAQYQKKSLCGYFEIKYFSDYYAHYLSTLLLEYYALTVDMEGNHFFGLKIEWNYDASYINIKIPNYISDALYHFQHTPPSQPQYSPHYHNSIRYG